MSESRDVSHLIRSVPDDVLMNEVVRRRRAAAHVNFDSQRVAMAELRAFFKSCGPVGEWTVFHHDEPLGTYVGHIVDVSLYLAALANPVLTFSHSHTLSPSVVQELSPVIYPSTADWVEVRIPVDSFMGVAPKNRAVMFKEWTLTVNPSILHGFVVDQSTEMGSVTIMRGTKLIPVNERNTPDRRIHRKGKFK